eukprot:1283803-Rhodomonas_salina.4
MAAELATLQQQVQAQQQQLGAAYGSVGFGGQQGYVPQFQPNPNLYAGSVSPGSWASNAMTTLTLDSRQPNFNMQFGGQAGSFQAPQFLQGYAQMPFAFNTQMQQQPGPYCSGGGGPGMQHINLFAIEEKPVSETQMEEPTAVEPSDEIDSTPTPMTEVTQLQGLQAINAIEAIKRQCCTTSTFDVVCNVAAWVLEVYQMLESEREEQPNFETQRACGLDRVAMVMIDIGDYLSGVPRTPGLAMMSAFTDRSEDDMWLVADTGANRHYIAREDFLCHICPSVSLIFGVGNAKIQSRKKGFFQGLLGTASGLELPFLGNRTHVTQGVSLFSIPVAVRNGHLVHFEGDPATGQNGMCLAGTNEWVPFHWDPSTNL